MAIVADIKNALGEQPVAAPRSILAVDIGGSKVKLLLSGETEPRRFLSGKSLTPTMMVERIREVAGEWQFDAISIGYPGLVGDTGPRSEPMNLGRGWVGFDFAAALGCPVRMINDAAMQALGSYDGGRMLFLGLGTGVGSTLIAENVIVTLELGDLPYDGKRKISEVLSRAALDKLGKGEWRKAVDRCVAMLTKAFLADYVVIGGGNARKIKELPPGARLGHNLTAFRGGFRLWHVEDVRTMTGGDGHGRHTAPAPPSSEWRLI